ncbi:MAG: 2-oxoacid:acceptor oxidoreductase family protein [Oscillospiraceae bacterium]|nr:2-oxoacid:acceptor oxidoreductase family protein [Oscillospiraceae bacterium]
MKEIIWIGRGGQGAFTAAKLFGAAYAGRGWSLAFPTFGPERRGAPVRAFTKLSDRPISDRSQTKRADHIVVLDKTLYSPELKWLLKEEGSIIVNTADPIDGVLTYDCDSIAAELRLPTVNTIMMGILSGVSGIVSADEICGAIKGYMPAKLHEKNEQAVRRAVDGVIS